MSEPWVDPVKFGTFYGGLGGGLIGALSGILAATAAVCKQTGHGGRFILIAFQSMFVFGIANLLAGVCAALSGQPFGITFPLLIIGMVLAVVFCALLPLLSRHFSNGRANNGAATPQRKSST
jgi:H+/Cl- antiporter ClcA